MEELRADFAPPPTSSRWTSSCGPPRAVPDADHGLQAAALPQRPALPHVHGRPADRRACRRLQPPRRRAAGQVLRHRLPAHPGPPDTKDAAERELLGLVDDLDIHLVVLARYMQILSDETLPAVERSRDQHPPLVPPSLQGRQALPRGVRPGGQAVGATAHYVTADLDEGPIIEQDVTRVDHTHSPEELVAAGVTWRRRCCPARCAGTRRAGCCSTATGRWSSAERSACSRSLSRSAPRVTCTDDGVRIQRTG